MKKIVSILAMVSCIAIYAQETPKKSCCAGKDAKECKIDKKTAKACDDKNHKDCKTDHSKEKKESKKAA